MQPGRFRQVTQAGPELDGQQFRRQPVAWPLDQVPGPQAGEKLLVITGTFHHGQELVVGHEEMLTNQIRQQDRIRVESVEPHGQQLPARRRQRGRVP